MKLFGFFGDFSLSCHYNRQMKEGKVLIWLLDPCVGLPWPASGRERQRNPHCRIIWNVLLFTCKIMSLVNQGIKQTTNYMQTSAVMEPYAVCFQTSSPQPRVTTETWIFFYTGNVLLAIVISYTEFKRRLRWICRILICLLFAGYYVSNILAKIT